MHAKSRIGYRLDWNAAMERAKALLAANMRRLAEKTGRTYRDLAKEIGATEAEISRYANGKRWPSPLRLQLIAEYFRVDIDELFVDVAKKPALPPDDPREAKLLNSLQEAFGMLGYKIEKIK